MDEWADRVCLISVRQWKIIEIINRKYASDREMGREFNEIYAREFFATISLAESSPNKLDI